MSLPGMRYTEAMSYSVKKPQSLDDVHHRIRVMVEHSGELADTWAAEVGVGQDTFRTWLVGSHAPPSRRLLKLDDLAGGLFLNPDEREWAEQALKRADAAARVYAKADGYAGRA